jgi:hypothetical protein
MSTNWYAEFNTCDCCSRGDTLHIGKTASMGGVSLRAYPDPPLPAWGTPIMSWEDWKDALHRADLIVDEYGEIGDAPELVTLFEGYSAEGRRVQFDWLVDHGKLREGRDWLDADGFSMSAGEFS